MNILLLHGPNLNLLGIREPEVYGRTTLSDINHHGQQLAKELGHNLTAHQSNAEHELIEFIQQSATGKTDLIIINPAALTHTSVALRDALLAVNIPFIEVHLSNTHAREDFRKHSFFSDKAIGIISGFGAYSYQLAIMAANDYYSRLKI